VISLLPFCLYKFPLFIKKEDPVIYFGLADTYIEMKKLDKAQEALKKSIFLNKEYADAYYNLAGLYAIKGDKSLAKENLDKAIALYYKQERFIEAFEYERTFKAYFEVK